ncbi:MULTISPECIES: O-antigen ligase family protein [unclassified Janthinobacterium]|uniref:O-antigen ligase family protein n=1 Tax=unclassified Janthinobacterium TaxID=2610881 RepID=UPI0016167FFD|nr:MULTISPECIES: O-antigen ligase family protein [unclassified Janthinobacterium]MBB5608605.1 hypothetical protein [Janthinobacterium sp. S3T4]MBB5614126.1 hypothetical protein [Janthinobacterium sp. S3M3]
MQNKTNHLPVLFLMGLLLASSDLANIGMGALKIKLSYIGFFAYFIIFAYNYGFKFNWKNACVSIILLILFLPSLIFSYNISTSIVFLVGTIMCVVVMLTFARMTAKLGLLIIPLLVGFYRFSVLLSVVLVLVGLQDRAHFLLYEPSYYAIFLIPYYCIVFYRLFHTGWKSALFDISLILIAIIFSQSVSMVLWSLFCFLSLYFTSGKVKFLHVIAISLSFLISIAVIASFHERTAAIVLSFFELIKDPSKYINLFVLIGGNRLQRVFIAYDAFLMHPVVGIGIGALKEYSTAHFSMNSFDFNGISASDFSTEMNATNIFMELMAEAGVVGLVGFLVVLVFVARKKSDIGIFSALKIAFIVTMISLLIESSYLRPYVWALYGVIIGFSSVKEKSLNKF